MIISQNHTLPVINFRIAYWISLQTLMSGIATPQLTCVSYYAGMWVGFLIQNPFYPSMDAKQVALT